MSEAKIISFVVYFVKGYMNLFHQNEGHRKQIRAFRF